MVLEPIPHLSREDISLRLHEVCKTRQRHYLVALYGTGDSGTILVSTEQMEREFEVIPVASELELRQKMPQLEEPAPAIVFLVPFANKLPLDLIGRFASEGRVLRLGRRSRLQALFGTRVVETKAEQSPLADYLLNEPLQDRERYQFAGAILTWEALWVTWLGAHYGLELEGGLTLESLLAWAARNNMYSSFHKFIEEQGLIRLREDLFDLLRQRCGEAGPVVWSCWEKGQGARALQYAAVFEVLGPSPDPAMIMWRKLVAQKEFELGAKETESIIDALGKAATPAIRLFSRRDDNKQSQLSRLLLGTDSLIDQPEVRKALITSDWLPCAWGLRLDKLGELLRQGVRKVSSDTVKQAHETLRGMENHWCFKQGDKLADYERAEMALRLLAWLASAPEKRVNPVGNSASNSMYGLAYWYVEEGGFVDWARHRARGESYSLFGKGVEAVLETVDKLRTQFDQQFAQALPLWLEYKRPAEHVVPISQVTERFVARFLKENPERRLLVILLDGMAWAQAVELLQSLSDWAPIQWNNTQRQPAGKTGPVLPVFASLPTETEFSRAAFFGGKELVSGRPPSTDMDKKRWEENSSIAKFFDGGFKPRLFLGFECCNNQGVIQPPVLAEVANERNRVVAVILNAIDSSLRADSQHGHYWSCEDIPPLRTLLEAARESRRTVLLASDHGHVPSDRLESVGAPLDAKSRWRPIALDSDPVAPYELIITRQEKSNQWTPPGAPGMVLLTDDSRRYGGSNQAGTHGGASLAEVVAPTLFIDSIHRELDLRDQENPDAELLLRPWPVPGWWLFETVSSQPAPRRPAGPTRKPSQPKQQTSLFPLDQEQPPATNPAKTPPPPKAETAGGKETAELAPLVKALAASKNFAGRAPQNEQLRSRLLAAVSYLVERDGKASLTALGSKLGLLPGRVPGLIMTAGDSLNLDGYMVLSYDPVAQLVSLDIARMRELFGIK